MKKALLVLCSALPVAIFGQCTTTNATSCDCLDGSTDCDLLPDITASWQLLSEPDETIESPGLLELSVGTPNIGHGPLRVLPTDNYVCGTDTINSPGGLDACPDGSLPHQIIQQRIYHKNGSTMTYWDRDAGTMTYHPTHGHFHTDNWGIYTLRKPVDGVTDPLLWPIIGYGTKMGFCLMDLANCATPSNYGYCREDDSTVITNDIENYGLGGGGYNCNINNQGISVGYLDIYDYYLDGMYIDIPPGTCNGDYMIVVQIDPNLNYIEESDNNNVISIPYTLTEQPEDVDFMPITYSGGTMTGPGHLTICSSDAVTLTASPVGTTYAWSNGATTSSITVTEAGDYYCLVSRDCGPLYTDTLHVELMNSEVPTVDPSGLVCIGSSATLTATGAGTIDWYDSPVGGTYLGTGSPFTSAPVFENTTFYAENVNEMVLPVDGHVGEVDHEGSDYSTGTPYNGYMVFDALNDMTLQSVKVITDYPGIRTIELRDPAEAVLQSIDVDIPSGTSVVDLNFDIPAGISYHLGTSGATNTTTFGDINPRLKRSDTGLSFPYTIGGITSINESSYGTTRWYYFYDWHVTGSTVFDCPSTRAGVDVEVKECTGVGDISNINMLSIYPNPAMDNFTIQMNTEPVKAMTVTVTNVTGQKVFVRTMNNASGDVTIPVASGGFAKGIYQITIDADGKSVSKNIVIE